MPRPPSSVSLPALPTSMSLPLLPEIVTPSVPMATATVPVATAVELLPVSVARAVTLRLKLVASAATVMARPAICAVVKSIPRRPDRAGVEGRTGRHARDLEGVLLGAVLVGEGSENIESNLAVGGPGRRIDDQGRLVGDGLHLDGQRVEHRRAAAGAVDGHHRQADQSSPPA